MRARTLGVMSVLLGLSSVAQANFITNGDFNTDLSGWTYNPFVNQSSAGVQWFNDGAINEQMGLIWGGQVDGGFLKQDGVNDLGGFDAAGTTYTTSFELINEGNGQTHVTVTLFDTTANEAAASLQVLFGQYEYPMTAFNFNYVVEPSRVGHTWRLDIVPDSWGTYTGADNVSVTAVPEPTSAALLGMLGTSLGLFARRTRK